MRNLRGKITALRGFVKFFCNFFREAAPAPLADAAGPTPRQAPATPAPRQTPAPGGPGADATGPAPRRGGPGRPRPRQPQRRLAASTAPRQPRPLARWPRPPAGSGPWRTRRHGGRAQWQVGTPGGRRPLARVAYGSVTITVTNMLTITINWSHIILIIRVSRFAISIP